MRLGACPCFPIAIDPDSQKFIWEIVKRLEDVDIFELPTERSPLVLFNRFESIDHELGNVIEPVSFSIVVYYELIQKRKILVFYLHIFLYSLGNST